MDAPCTGAWRGGASAERRFGLGATRSAHMPTFMLAGSTFANLGTEDRSKTLAMRDP